jgi:DNA-binding CsgD family transcriptional regulator
MKTAPSQGGLAARSNSLPPSVGAAAELVLGARGDEEKLMRVFDWSPAPMVMVDNHRRYVEANRPARLLLRLTVSELRGYRIDDLTPAHVLPTMSEAWARLLNAGCVAGTDDVAAPDGSSFDIVYCGLANALPGLHLIVFAPAGWSHEELSVNGNGGRGPSPAPLTPREREVLQLAAEGLSGPDIAERLVVSAATVKTHFSNIYKKLGVNDRAAAVARGLRLGFIH